MRNAVHDGGEEGQRAKRVKRQQERDVGGQDCVVHGGDCGDRYGGMEWRWLSTRGQLVHHGVPGGALDQFTGAQRQILAKAPACQLHTDG
jgi:hypothetical protein